MRAIMQYNKKQMQSIIEKGGSPTCAKFLAAKFNYFYALAINCNNVEKHFNELKAMYQDFHRQANAEGWQPAKIEKFE